MPKHKLNESAINQGYYSKFFIELRKLGRGFRGSVYLCEHILDGVKLGKYAVKKVAIGRKKKRRKRITYIYIYIREWIANIYLFILLFLDDL